MTPTDAFLRNLSFLKTSRGVTDRWIGEHLKMERSTVTHMRRNAQNLNLDTAWQLCELFSVRLENMCQEGFQTQHLRK